MSGIPATAAIVSVVPGVSATISTPTTAAQAATGNVGTGNQMVFTDATLSTGNVFTTNGVNGGQANIGIISADGFTINSSINLVFGGTDGVGATNCVLTGSDSGQLRARPARLAYAIDASWLDHPAGYGQRWVHQPGRHGTEDHASGRCVRPIDRHSTDGEQPDREPR